MTDHLGKKLVVEITPTPLAVLKTPETEDIGFHSQSVPVHTEGLRFRQRLTVPPAVRGDPIAGHDRSCAVFPLFTVDKNPIPGIQNREDLNDVRQQGARRNGKETP